MLPPISGLDQKFMASAPSTRAKVFVSYSHVDKEWLRRLMTYLKPAVREGMDCWDDTHIRPGDDWKQEIRNALATAQVAVLLISPNFFASDFIDAEELPQLLTAAKQKGIRILPVILSACRFARDPNLAQFQAVNLPNRPLDEMPPPEQGRVLDCLAQAIEETIKEPNQFETKLLWRGMYSADWAIYVDGETIVLQYRKPLNKLLSVKKPYIMANGELLFSKIRFQQKFLGPVFRLSPSDMGHFFTINFELKNKKRYYQTVLQSKLLFYTKYRIKIDGKVVFDELST